MKVCVGQIQNRKKLNRLLTESLTAWFLAFGLMITADRTLGTGVSWIILVLAAGIPVLLFELIPRKEVSYAGTTALILIPALLALAGQKNFVNGLLILNNCMAEAAGRNHGIILKQYALKSTETAGNDLIIAAVFAGLLTGAVMYWVMKYGRIWLTVFWLILLVGFAALTGNSAGYMGPVLTGAGFLGMVSLRVYVNAKTEVKGGDSTVSFIMYLFLIVTAGLGMILTVWINPPKSYNEPDLTKKIRAAEKEAVESVRYGNKKINSLPKGNLKNLGSWKASGETALTVTMSEPQSLYLRGFTGSDYSSGEWKKLSNEEYYDSDSLFYWLHQEGFDSSAQLDTARQLVSDPDLSDQDITVAVKNNNADSEYLYVPYELKKDSWGSKKLKHNADESLESAGFFGIRDYGFHTTGNLVIDFAKLAAETFLMMTENPDTEYEQAESYYNVFAYKHYTELTRSQNELMQKLLGDPGEQKEGHIDYYSAITEIRKFFDKNISFNKECGTVPKGKDPVNYFLTESGTGYDVHYASAAVLMFRYYGIPSRYVEGYVITSEAAENAEAGSAIKIPASDGHAWPEIYIDGLGWVPVEVSPDFEKVMEQPDLTEGLEAGTTAASAQSMVEDSEEIQEKSLPELLKETMFDLLRIVFVLFVGFDLIVLLFIIISVIRRITAAFRRKKLFRVQNSEKAVLAMMKYASDLFLYGHSDLYGIKKSEKVQYLRVNYSEELAQMYLKACESGERAALSRHSVSKEEREKVKEYMEQLRREVLKKAGWYDRFIMRYIERLC